LLFLLLLSVATRAENPKQIHPTDYVTDLAGIIPADSKARLDALCLELQQKTGAQMAIVTVRSLENESVEQFANEVFQTFGVGEKKENNGILLLIAPNDRKYWTEVGYGLEPIINDARAGDAGRAMVPYFREGNYSRGIEVAARQLADYIAQDKGATLSGETPRHPQPVQQPSNDNVFGGIFAALFFLFVIGSSLFNFFRWLARSTNGIGGGTYRKRNRYDNSGTWFGGGFGGGGWGGFGGGGFGGGGDGGGGFGGFGGGSSGGGGAGGSW
jgi:uncharacterized protein